MNNFENIIQKKINRFLFFLVSSFIMIFGINASFFLFIPVFLSVVKNPRFEFFKFNSKYKIFSFLFALGALLGTAKHFLSNSALLSNTLAVLPNYIYWTLIIFSIITIITKIKINQFSLFKIITTSVLFVSFYYLILQDFISNPYFFKDFQKNNFAFLIITYAPYLVYYLKKKYSNTVSVFVFTLILMILLIEERRAGFVLTFIGGSLSYAVEKIKFTSISNVFKLLLIPFFFLLFIQISPIKKIIQNSSPRVYGLIYEDNSKLNIDRSALTRKAMVEKGLVLFNENIFFGVGLNNFTKVEASITGNFEGARFVIGKDIFERTSSHNSYINILAEGGLFLAIPFGLILLFLIKDGFLYFNYLNTFDKVSFFSFLVMISHFYFMNSVVNSLAWLNIGLVASFLSKRINEIKRIN